MFHKPTITPLLFRGHRAIIPPSAPQLRGAFLFLKRKFMKKGYVPQNELVKANLSKKSKKGLKKGYKKSSEENAAEDKGESKAFEKKEK